MQYLLDYAKFTIGQYAGRELTQTIRFWAFEAGLRSCKLEKRVEKRVTSKLTGKRGQGVGDTPEGHGTL